MLFSDIPGQTHLKEVLTRSAETGQIAHARLFAATEGSAAMPLALAYAQYINCLEPDVSAHDACGRCASCSKYSKLAHPDLHMAYPVSAVQGKKAESDDFAEQWRKFVTEQPFGTKSSWLHYIGAENKQPLISVKEARNILGKLHLKSFEAKYKVMLIWQPEYMNVQAANALLKVLEEPPQGTLFLLITYQPDRLLTTILSRCQKMIIKPFERQEISQYLQHNRRMAAEQADRLAFLAQGNMQQALENIAVDDFYNRFVRWMRFCYMQAFDEIVKEARTFSDLDKDGQRNFLFYGLNMMREAVVTLAQTPELVHLPEAQKGFINKFAPTLNRQSCEQIHVFLGEALWHLDQNAHATILFFDLSLQVTQAFGRPIK